MNIIIYLSLFTTYLLCFLFLYSTNTEYLCLILLLLLNLFLLLFFYYHFIINKNSFLPTITMIPYMILGWNGKIPLYVIFLITWSLLFIANTMLINTYRKLHSKFSSMNSIDLGSLKHYNDKNYLKLFMIITTLLLFILITLSFTNLPLDNNIKLLLSILSLVISSICIFLSNKIAKNTNIISQ